MKFKMLNRISLKIYRIKFGLRTFIATKPEIFFPLVKFTKSKKLLVNKNSDILIEGFPRCGNSFAVDAFMLAQNTKYNIATHLHAPAQIIYSVKYNIPTVVTIRNPVDSVVSFIAMFKEVNEIQNKVAVYPSIEQLLRSYLIFYSSIINIKKKFVTANFEQITTDFGQVIRNVNYFYKTDFQVFKHNKNNVDIVLQKAGIHAGPTEYRSQIKRNLYKEIKNPKYDKLVKESSDLYNKFLSN